MAPAVSFREAVVLLGRFPALTGVDLDVEPGEVVLLEGANGAGKTTLLRACAGLSKVSAGEAHVLGYDLRADRRAVRSEVGLLGHQGFLYDDLTAIENVRFAARAARRSPTEAEAALERVGLTGRTTILEVALLSAGQRRRTALASFLVRRPLLWLLDEPHAALDASGRAMVDAVVAEAAAGGAAVLLSSHEGPAGAPGASRRVTVAGGRVVPAPPDSSPAPPAPAAAPSGIEAAHAS